MNAVRIIASNTPIIPGTIKLLEGLKSLKTIYPPRINPWNAIAIIETIKESYNRNGRIKPSEGINRSFKSRRIIYLTFAI